MEFEQTNSRVFSNRFILYSAIFIVVVGMLLYLAETFNKQELQEMEHQPVLDTIISVSPNDI